MHLKIFKKKKKKLKKKNSFFSTINRLIIMSEVIRKYSLLA